MKLKINVNQICKIKIYYKLRDSRYVYKEKSGRFFWKRKEGFYSIGLWGDLTYVTQKQITDSGNGTLYCEDNIIYYFPHIEIYLSNSHCVIDWFDSSENLDRFVQEYLKDIPLITIHG